jgi:hypothetical protein
MKVCKKCGIEKSEDLFYKTRSVCKNCIKKYKEQYYLLNKNILEKKRKSYYCLNKDGISKKAKTYYNLNKEKHLQRMKLYRENNKEKLSEYFKKNIYAKRKNNEIYRFKNAISHLIRESFKRSNHRKNSKSVDILGCSIEDFKIYLQSKFKKNMTFTNHGNWHLDHIIPISSAKTEEEVIRLNHYTNFQPLWAEENLKKSNKIIEQQLILI